MSRMGPEGPIGPELGDPGRTGWLPLVSDLGLIMPISEDKEGFHMKTAWLRFQGQKCAVVVYY